MKNLTTAAVAMLTIIAVADAAAACWRPLAAPGALSFISSQAGAPLEGTFKKFSAQICLDADQPGHIEVTVETGTVDTMLPELDDILTGSDFLDSATYPRAVFVSDDIKALGKSHFEVTGRFTLRDVTRTITVPFDLKPAQDGKGSRLEGSTTIKRLDYGVGQGEWRDTKWVADEVTLKFSVALTEAGPG